MPTQQRYNRTPLPSNFDMDGFAEIVAQKIWGKIAKMTNIPDEWLTLKDVMKITKLSKSAVYNAMNRDESPLKSYRAGGSLRFKREDVNDFIAENI